MSIKPPVQVSTADRFEAEVRQLGKRYRRIRLDIQPVIAQTSKPPKPPSSKSPKPPGKKA